LAKKLQRDNVKFVLTKSLSVKSPSKTDGQEPVPSSPDEKKEKLNTLDALIKLRTKAASDTAKESGDKENDEPDELGGLEGFSGTF